MPDRERDLEKTTQTDLLYGMAGAAPRAAEETDLSDVALLDAPSEAVENSDAIHQHAATRDDSGLVAQLHELRVASGQTGKRWRYLDGFLPPEKTPPSTSLPVVVDQARPHTWRERAGALARGSSSWMASLLLHVILLPSMILITTAETAPRSRPALEIYNGVAPEPFEFVEAPSIVALPSNYEANVSLPVSQEMAVPDPRFEKGAMPGLMAAPKVAAPPAKRMRGPVDEIAGLMKAVAQGKAASSKGKGGAEFFGTKAHGNKFVFVVDCSLSMLENDRWLDAANELCNAIDRLQPEQQFYVILFDGGVHRMFHHSEREAALFPATDENKKLCREWLTTVRLGYETRPFLAVKNALELGPDAIYLLSDGDFKDRTADYLKKYNRPFDHFGQPQHQVVLHTFSFHSRLGQPVMRRIAHENAGQYVFIPAK
jgi:hypothetical protein